MSLTAICPISQNPISIPGFLHCGHEFGKKTITTWADIGRACPICREVCSVQEISDTAREAAQKANQLVKKKLLQVDEFEKKEGHIEISPGDMTVVQTIQNRLNVTSRKIFSTTTYLSEDANHVYQLFVSRILTQLAQNVDSILNAAGMQHSNVQVIGTSSAIQEKIELDFTRAFVIHMLTAFSPLQLHALMEDGAMHEMIVPPAYKGLLSCEPRVSSCELAREYMLCEKIQRSDRECILESVRGYTTYERTQRLGQGEFAHLLSSSPSSSLTRSCYERMLVHLNSLLGLQGKENMRLIDLFLSVDFTLPVSQQALSLESQRAFTRTQVEFLLSTILARSFPTEMNRDEQSKALEELKCLAEQIDHPATGAKVEISQRLYQILGDLLPSEKEKTSEEVGRSALPQLFHTIHPKAILYAIAQLRSELYASWRFSDSTDYQQEWTDMQTTVRTLGHLQI